MIVVSDSSPIIYLSIVGRLDILQVLFERIIIPEAVYNELTIHGKGQPGSQEVLDSDWIEVRYCSDMSLFKVLETQLDIGEAQAITIAQELHADLLLIDERLGRNVAKSLDIPIIGLLGIFNLAKKKGIVSYVKPIIDQLITNVGFRVSSELYRTFLISLNENPSE